MPDEKEKQILTPSPDSTKPKKESFSVPKPNPNPPKNPFENPDPFRKNHKDSPQKEGG